MSTTRTAIVAALIGGAAGVLVLYSAAIQPQERTLTGCVRAGSAPGVFLLRAATEPGSESGAAGGQAATTQEPDDYVLVGAPPQINLSEHLNRRTAITGPVSDAKSDPPAPAGANAAERALKRVTVKGVKPVAPTCATER